MGRGSFGNCVHDLKEPDVGDATVVRPNQNNAMHNNEKTLPGIDVLNTGYGDLELRFDPSNLEEVERAKQTITDMLRRGYAIFVRLGTQTSRVRKFDVERNVYIIGSTPAEEVPIGQTRATAVGRSAGG